MEIQIVNILRQLMLLCLCKWIKYLDIFPDRYLFHQSNKDTFPALKEMKRTYHQCIFLSEMCKWNFKLSSYKQLSMCMITLLNLLKLCE